MTAIPTSSLAIATDTTVSTGPEVGLTVRADPGSGNLAQGAISGFLYPARWLNWLVGGLADWCSYLREASPARLSSTARTFFVPIERAVDVTSGTSATENPAHTSALAGGTTTLLGAGNALQPMLVQYGTSRVWTVDLSDILPKDGLLTEISVGVIGDSAWSPNIPTTLPAIGLVRVSSDAANLINQNIRTVIAGSGQIDTSANFTAFATYHRITSTLATPLDLSTAGQADQTRIYLEIDGAVDGTGDIAPVYYLNARAKVTSKPWV